jgi:hypothetical protein
MTEVLQGVIHGKTIELLTDSGVPDGQIVEITIRTLDAPDPRIAAVLRTAGSMADDSEFDSVMEQARRDRVSGGYREHGA